MRFADVPIGAYFDFEATIYLRVEAEGLWNARCGDRWAQFEDDEEVKATSYRPPPGWLATQEIDTDVDTPP